MKWIENGVQFEGTVSEYKELHEGGIPAPVRTRKGKSITVINNDGTQTQFETLKDAAIYISTQTGRFVSPSHLGHLNGRTVELSSFAPGKEIPLFKQEETPALIAAEPATEQAPATEEPAQTSAN